MAFQGMLLYVRTDLHLLIIPMQQMIGDKIIATTTMAIPGAIINSDPIDRNIRIKTENRVLKDAVSKMFEYLKIKKT